MLKNIPIKCNDRNFYRYYVELLNPIIKLRKKELDVLANLLYYDNKYKDLEDKIRYKIIFDQDTKLEIREALNLSEASLNNNLSELRKKKIIVNNQISKGYRVYPGEDNKLVFNFVINADSE
jgi:hypothetical protein